jgi:RNA processing factor Prp31
MDISDIDLLNIDQFSKRVISLAEVCLSGCPDVPHWPQYRQSLFTYLQARMQNVAPNLAALVGEQVCTSARVLYSVPILKGASFRLFYSLRIHRSRSAHV